MKHLILPILILCQLLSGILNSQEIFDSTIVVYEQTLLFESGEHKLSLQNISQLDSLIERTTTKKNTKLFIDAHTDDVGSVESNLILSKKRKQSVQEYLINSSIHESLITSRYHGENDFKTNKTDQNSRELNRRVVVKMISDQKFIKLSGEIVDEITKDGIQGIIEVNTRNFKYSSQSNPHGQYRVVLPLDEILTLNFFAKDYFFENRIIKTNPQLNIGKTPLKKASIGSKLILKNINFKPNQNVLIEKSKPYLTYLTKFLNNSPETCIELSGHINSYGGPHNPNDDLSKARALIILEKIKKSGINPNRILVKGYGDSDKLFFKPESSQEQAANMRVEIKIVKCDSIASISSDTLTKPQYYSNIVIDRLFKHDKFPNEIKYFPYRHRSSILAKLKELKSLDEDPEKFNYKQLLEAGQKLKFQHNETAIKLRNIYTKDQHLRNLTNQVENVYGLDSRELEEHWRKIKIQDSLNLIDVKNILDQKGWLSANEVSDQGNAALFLVLQHSNLEDQIKYLPMLRKAVENGKASGQDLALMEDRIALAQGKEQIYGSQILRNPDNGEHFLAPFKNPNNLNVRRKKIGLIPIEDYLLHWNLDWQLELKRMNKIK